jgi:23S rRNA (guanosine2251-2'-O)-methyltransferase
LKGKTLLYGINPVVEALKTRPHAVQKILIAEGKGSKGIQQIAALSQTLRILIICTRKEELTQIAHTNDHQGVVAIAASYPYASLDDILRKWKVSNERLLILALDSIQDPHNLGAIIRSAHLFGVHGVILPKDRACPITPVVAKASAGAVEYTPIVRVTNLVTALKALKGKGAWIIGASADAGQNIYSFRFDLDLVLVIGGEDEGVRPLVRKECDHILSIPIHGNISSFNTSAACAVILSEVIRQRRFAK